MQVSVNMGLNIWDSLNDSYDHIQLAANWTAVDQHDHTSGKGIQIPTAGIVDSGISTIKIANSAVTTTKIAANGVQTTNIQNSAVTVDKLDPSLLSGLLPLGSVIAWWRSSGSVAVPTGFVLCVGGTLTQANHDFGAFSITIPNLVDTFIMGVGSGGEEKTSGGANTHTLEHHHTIPDHHHVAPPHHHAVADHQHTVTNHGHAIGADGTHSHTFAGGSVAHQRPYQISDGSLGVRQALYASGFNTGNSDVPAPMDSAGSHSHGAVTGGSSPLTSFNGAQNTTDAGSVSTTGVTESGSALQTTGVQGGTTSADFRPAYFGLLYIMKVKNRTV